MKIRTVGRHIREGAKNITRNGWMTFAAVSAVTVTLLILGLFLLLAMNVNFIAENVKNEVELRAFVSDEIDDAGIKQINEQLSALSDVKEVDFIPREEALEMLKESFGDKGFLLEGYEDENPLPNGFVVRVFTPENMPEVAKQVEQISGIYKVNYGEDYVDVLFQVTDVVRNVGIVFILGLSFTAMFLIANTIKITIMARRKEIEIQKLVGATNAFIRWPFFVEGLILGVLGSILPIIVLVFGYNALLKQVSSDITISFIRLLPLNPLAYQISGLLLAIGAIIGIWGSMMSVRRFLKV